MIVYMITSVSFNSCLFMENQSQWNLKWFLNQIVHFDNTSQLSENRHGNIWSPYRHVHFVFEASKNMLIYTCFILPVDAYDVTREMPELW